MAQQDTGQEKTEKATPKRLREARKKGQVAKSKDLTSIGELILVFVVLCFTLAYMGRELRGLYVLVFKSLEHSEITGAILWQLGKASLVTMGKALAPVFIGGVVAALAIGYAQVGGLFSAEPLKPQFNKLNPVEGLKNMFKVTTFIELVKNIAKIGLVFFFAYQVIKKHLAQVLLSSKVDMTYSVHIAGDILFDFMIRVAIAFAIIALIDYAVQHWQFMKQMRMTKDEVKREYKQDEGDPDVKRERRRLHREMVFGDARQAVQQASAVVTNPVHIAVAIAYDGAEHSVPIVTTKGMRLYAETIKKYADEFNVPIFRNVPLAWSLHDVEIGDPIPDELFDAVAEILAVVYRMQAEKEAQQAQKISYA